MATESSLSKNILDIVIVRDPSVRSSYKNGQKTPITKFIEDYMNGRVDCTVDIRQLMMHRTDYFDYGLVGHHAGFVFKKFIPQVAIHSKKQDERIVRDHYDRRNDFFSGFLGERMIYRSAFYKTGKESLTEAQDNKLDLVSRKLQLKPGDRLLDFGCGWGTLLAHTAKYHGVDATGISIAQAGVDYANQQIEDWGQTGKARALQMDYRAVPADQYDKISCLEMAEHVGVKYFQRFMKQIHGLLKDDGLFYLQIAGLKAGLHKESLIWGAFMNEYIFPGADASMPLSWVLSRLEKAGFEIHSVENVGIHYSKTIQQWYDNWMDNAEEMEREYGQWWYRCWEIFLGWSVDIAAQGNSTAFQIVCNKNSENFDRNRWVGKVGLGEHEQEEEIRE